MALDLAPHQEQAIEQLDNGKILVGGVGTGKSRTAVGYYMKKEADADVYVITTAKKRDALDWEGEFAKAGVGRNLNGTCAGRLTVDSWNNIGKYRDVRGAFFIFDEQRLVGSGEWSSVFLRISQNNRWILLTATPGDSWMDYVPVFVANGFYKNRTHFKREHVVYSPFIKKFPKIDRYIQTGKLIRLRNQILVDMPYLRHTVRVHVELSCDYDVDAMKKAMSERWHPYDQRPLKDAGELFSVMRRIVGSSPSRLLAVRALLEAYPRLIVFYNYNHELELLRSLADCTMVAEWNGHLHQEVPRGRSWVYLVQYSAGAEGWNCTSTDAMVFWSRPYSYKVWEQAQGRIDRMNTSFSKLHYFTLQSPAWIDRKVKEALDGKKDFHESAFRWQFKEELG